MHYQKVCYNVTVMNIVIGGKKCHTRWRLQMVIDH